jgi:YVTN family beta-propeller protein
MPRVWSGWVRPAACVAVTLGAVLPAAPAPAAGAPYAVSATIAVGAQPGFVAVDPGTHDVYVSHPDAGTVTVVRGGSVVGTIATGGRPAGIGIDPSTHVIYVADNSGGRVFVVQGTAVTGTIAVSGAPSTVAVDPGTHTVWVTNDSSVLALDGGSVTAALPLLGYGTVEVDPMTHNVYVTDIPGHFVTVIEDRAVTGAIAVGVNPEVARVDPGTGTIFVSELVGTGASNVSIIRGGAVVGGLQAGRGGLGLALDPTTHVAYRTNLYDNTVSVLTADQILATIPVGQGPDGVAVDPSTHAAYVANADSGTLSVITPLTPGSPTSTTVRCAPKAPRVGRGARCTAVVSAAGAPAAASGTVTFSASGPGSFPGGATCTLVVHGARARCRVVYVPAAGGPASQSIDAAYGGDASHAASTGSTTIRVRTGR